MKNVLITGISGGIGRAVAEKLIEQGISVIGTTRGIRDDMKGFSEKSRLLSLYETDLTEVDKLGDLIKTIVSEHGPVGGFVHCAGFDKMVPLHMTKPGDMEELWRIHAQVPMTMVATLCKKKNHDENTSIVLISSQSAHEGAMGHTAYASAKGAIEGYLAPAAAELMEKGIRLNEVCLAPVKTPMAEGWINKLSEDGRQRLVDSYPLGIGETEDAAGLICFLLSESSKWINGQIITADGGHAVRKT